MKIASSREEDRGMYRHLFPPRLMRGRGGEGLDLVLTGKEAMDDSGGHKGHFFRDV